MYINWLKAVLASINYLEINIGNLFVGFSSHFLVSVPFDDTFRVSLGCFFIIGMTSQVLFLQPVIGKLLNVQSYVILGLANRPPIKTLVYFKSI
jgi:hypothetical protein